MILFTLLAAWIAADFISGIVHWWEDRALIGQSRFEFINSVRVDNERHHDSPGYFLRYSWWGNISTTAPSAWGASFIALILFGPGFICFMFLFLGFGNLVHRWAHEPPKRCPRPIKLLQLTGLFLSYEHHAEHHFSVNGKRLLSRNESTRRYCVMSCWLNPVLDKIGFFYFLEVIFGKCSV